ncbi:hypothetical protein MAR_008749, partial [Mya arenaria]
MMGYRKCFVQDFVIVLILFKSILCTTVPFLSFMTKKNLAVDKAETFMETKSASYFECVAKCSKHPTCNTVSFSVAGQCLLSGEVLVFGNGLSTKLTDGQGWKTAFKFIYRVTAKRGVNGHNTLTFAEAAGRCEDYGLTIATPVQVLEARTQGMEKCNCAWLSDGSSGLILQSERLSCTSYPYHDGIMTAPCASRTLQNVWC